MKRFFFLSGIAALLIGCGGGGVSVNASHEYLGTQGPGDVWDWAFDGNTFTATNETKNLHYAGTKSVLATGFLKLQLTSTDDPNVTLGQSAYAVEVPGTALMLKMAGDDALRPVVAGCLGSNPAGPQVSFNFVAVGGLNFDPVTSQAYGHVTYDVSGNAYTGTAHRWAIDGTALSDSPSYITGDNGLMTDHDTQGGNMTATGAMSPTGVCVLDYGPNAGGVIGVKQPAANIDFADLASRSYRGFLINQGKTQCVSVTPNGNGTLHGVGYANPNGVETGTYDDGAGVTVNFIGQPNPGECTITLTTSGGTESLVAAINVVDGKYVMFCFGVGQDQVPYNVILVEN
ncbi:MAG TPA: hypothetical protein VHE55_02640 [Fimbriimonadaceae bacterium]|nr:hypothetical protein [Fimbriimonadaceae bacterium]